MSKSEEEELIIISGPKTALVWASRKARALWSTYTGKVHALLAVGMGWMLSIPGGIEWLQANIVWLTQIAAEHFGLLAPALDARTAAVVAFSLNVLTLILRGRTAGKAVCK